MKELTFTVTIDEANLILDGLGHLPFASVYALVAKVQMQAKAQIEALREDGRVRDMPSPSSMETRQIGQEAAHGE